MTHIQMYLPADLAWSAVLPDRRRPSTPSPRPGVFMAMHFNRYYCGGLDERAPRSSGPVASGKGKGLGFGV